KLNDSEGMWQRVYLKWYMNDYLIHIVRLKYDTGT
ncbi:hypothetical protein M084_4802, partial [Bacteroides fragilis str. 3988 T1]